MDSFVETPDGAGTIISVNTLREKVRVRLDLSLIHICLVDHMALIGVHGLQGDIPAVFDHFDGNFIGQALEAVSYTHLDVYKRQCMHHVQRTGPVFCVLL